jgi:hypothetical protein
LSSLYHHRSRLATALVLSIGLTGLGIAQTRTPAARPAATVLSALPASDAVARIKLKQVLNEVLPKLLATNPAKLAEVNSQIDHFKTRTGLDPRSFDELALGLRYTYPAPGITKVKTVAIARGSYNAAAMAAAGRAAASGKYREEKYQGKTINVFTLDQQVRLLGLLNLKISELAVSPLESDTVCLGDRESVRRAIDARRGVRQGNADLIALAMRDETAIVGFGGNVSPAMVENLRIGNDAIATDLATVRQMYGSFSMTTKDLEILLAARTTTPSSARSLGETVEGLKQFGAVFISQLSSRKGTLAKSALGNLKITTQGNELQIRTAVAQADVAPLIGGL